MKLESSNKVDVNRWELEISIPPEEFSKEVDKAYNKQKGKITIPGFRKGKAPRAFIEKYYGEQVFYEDAVNSLYPYAIDSAAKEAKLEIIDDKIDFDIVKMSKTDGLVFKVKVTVMPEVTVENYKGIEVAKKEATAVTAKDVEEALEEVRIRQARLVTSDDGEAAMGDVANIDFKGMVDGVTFDGGTASGYPLELGKHQFIAGFEEQIVGHKVGDEFTVNVTFPQDYHVEALAGKPATFETKLNKLQKRQLPTLDDEFVKDISEFDTLDEFKKDLEAKLAKEKEQKAQNAADNELIEKFIQLVKVDVPDALVRAQLKEMMREFEYNLKSQGISIDDYFKYTGSSAEKMEETFRPQALKKVTFELGLKKIAELENIVVSDEDITKEYEKIAAEYKIKPEQVKNFVAAADVKRSILNSKALEIIKQSKVEK